MYLSPSQIPTPAIVRGSDGCHNCIYTPGNTSGGGPTREGIARERSELLQKIHDSYECAYKRLTMVNVEIPFVGAGLSFGLLDPTTNIIYSTLTASVLCRGATDTATDKLSDIKGVNLLDMAQRSLDCLVAFLTCFFRYLADWEAVRYLLVAGADLVVAVRLVVHDRCLYMFDFNSDTSKSIVRTALMCAALASKHMNPEHLVRTWLSPSCSLNEAAQAIQNDISNSTGVFFNTVHCAGRGPDMQMQPLDFAWNRALAIPRSIAVRHRHYLSVKFTVLDLIHTFYLKALARLPATELRSCYHESLLKAGHCYGPFDPVSNIIVNTIWYNTVSPPTQTLEFDMISTKSLLRIEARSFYGLVSFLCARGKKLYGAMRILLRSNCTFGEFNSLATFGDQTDIYNALRVAGEAAWHPNPVAQAEFLSSCSVSTLNPLPPGDAPLDSADVRRIAGMLCPGSPTRGKTLQHQPVPRPKVSRLVRYRISNLKCEHTRISKKVKAALASYALQNKEPMYDLHVICGVNHSVSGPDYCVDTHGPNLVYHHIHVNFLASQRGENPKLFFAELSNDKARDEGGKAPLCCPVNFPQTCQEQIRCLYCDFEGAKIVHPDKEEFQFKGRDLEFQKMVCGKDPYEEEIDPDGVQMYTNNTIISVSRLEVDRVGALVDDYIYTNYDDDTDEEYDSDDDIIE